MIEVAQSLPLFELEDRRRISEASKKPLSPEVLNEVCIRVAMILMIQKGETNDSISQFVREATAIKNPLGS